MATVFDTRQMDSDGAPVSNQSPLVATNDAMRAANIESSRLRYDDRPGIVTLNARTSLGVACREAFSKTAVPARTGGMAWSGSFASPFMAVLVATMT